MNEYKDTVDMTFEEFLEKVAKMNFEDYMRYIKSSLNAPKVLLKRKPNEMRISLFDGKILLAWKANLDIQIVLEPYGCASYIVGYISKSQRGKSAQLDTVANSKRGSKRKFWSEETSQTYRKCLFKLCWSECSRGCLSCFANPFDKMHNGHCFHQYIFSWRKNILAKT